MSIVMRNLFTFNDFNLDPLFQFTKFFLRKDKYNIAKTDGISKTNAIEENQRNKDKTTKMPTKFTLSILIINKTTKNASIAYCLNSQE